MAACGTSMLAALRHVPDRAESGEHGRANMQGLRARLADSCDACQAGGAVSHQLFGSPGTSRRSWLPDRSDRGRQGWGAGLSGRRALCMLAPCGGCHASGAGCLFG